MKHEGDTLAAAVLDRETCLHEIEERQTYVGVLDRIIAELSGKGGTPQLVAKKPRRQTRKRRTGPSVQREIEIFCFAAIREATAEKLSTIALLGLIEQEFGAGRSIGAVTQMLASCPCFVREGGGRGRGQPEVSWRNVKKSEWDAAYAYALERNWPGSDDFEYATVGIDEVAEAENDEAEAGQKNLNFG